MAHSFIYAKINSNTERSVAIPDSQLHLFIYFFCEASKRDIKPNSIEREIYDHYRVEVLEYRWSCMDIMLEEVSADLLLRSWYLQSLHKLETMLEGLGEFIDNDYLNSIPELLAAFPKNEVRYNSPYPVELLIDVIGAIRWVLNEGEMGPPEFFRWFVEVDGVVVLDGPVKD